VKETHEALNGGAPEARVIPDSRSLVSQELLLFENGGSDDLEKFSDSLFRVARLNLRLPESDAVVYQHFLEELDAGLASTLAPLAYEVTGRTVLAARSMVVLITSMGSSYVIALVVITPLMILLIGDLRLGLISMVPNLLPVIFVLGVMGWMGLPLDASNIVIGSIIIGLAVDDTIHFLQRFRREFEETADVEAAVRRTMRLTGSALFFTSLVLSTGFLVMALRGSMLNTIQFGALSAAGISFAFLADVIVTPALITVSRGLLRTVPAKSPDGPLLSPGRSRAA
jgi:predicted RND superfamily exporter protein